jgi:long-chain acyl-CoA synthetase
VQPRDPAVELIELSETVHPWHAEDGDTAVVLYTSGTTGRPEGAELSHANLLSNVLLGEQLARYDPARPDTYLCPLPLFHSFGQTCVQNTAIAYGGSRLAAAAPDPTRTADQLQIDTTRLNTERGQA